MKKLLFILFDTRLLKDYLKIKVNSYFSLIFYYKEYNKIITYLKNDNRYIAVLDSNSIGAFVSQINHYFKVSKIYNLSLNDNFYFICEKKICNNFLFDKLTSNLKIEFNDNFHNRLTYLNHLEFFNKKKLAIYYNNDQVNFLPSINYNISFSNNEIEKAETILNKIGIKKDDKLVGISCKTNTYWQNRKVNKFWDVYRTSDFKFLNETCNYLESIGYKVIILGEIKLEGESKKFCNLMNLPKNERELIDVYIYKKLKFFINGMSGITNLAIMNNLDILYINYTLNYHQDKGVYLPKKIKNSKNYYLSLNEILKIKKLSFTHNRAVSNYVDFIRPLLFRNIKTFIGCDLYLEENSSEEILEATKELINYIEDKDKFIKNNKSNIDRFKKIYFKNKIKFVDSGVTSNGIISPNFINKFKNYLE